MKALPILAVLSVCASLHGAESYLHGTAAIKQALARLQTGGRVLMIAAHPDDENTAVLSYFARGRHMRAAYLSLTRGEGGQNRIGPEKGAELGVIRRQELLAARRIDGAEQFFTTAAAFGYSKSAQETFAKWGHQKVLGEAVRVIRQFQPHVIILRFSGTPRDGHGHHQASAMIGKEAFRAAADPKQFPEQLKDLQPWQATRIVWNLFGFTAQMEREASQARNTVMIDAGEFDPVLGRSYAEIAGLSRSMHKSQGFGSAERRGSQKHYFVHVEGDRARGDLFDGVAAQVSGDAGTLLARAAREFVPEHPERIIPILLQARPLLGARAAEVDEAIALCSGLWLDANASQHLSTPENPVEVRITILNRSLYPWTKARAQIAGAPPLDIVGPFESNRSVMRTLHMRLAPEAAAEFSIDGVRLVRPVMHRYVDPVEGERVREVVAAPAVSLNMADAALLFPDASPRQVAVQVQALAGRQQGSVSLRAAAGWTMEPAAREFRLQRAGAQEQLWFTVTPPDSPARATLRAVALVGGQEIASGLETISYPHIPPQTLQTPAARELVRADVRVAARRIGYVGGAGDEIPDALAQIGCEVTMLSPTDLQNRRLDDFEAIVTGVRAYSVHPELSARQGRLMEYVQAGGTLIVQYNERPPVELGPYPIAIYPSGQGRVSMEEAPVGILKPNHPLLAQPNQITAQDFEGWVQERGLYFAKTWDPRYETVLASHDPGEPSLPGGLLYTRYGKGVYIFTAYAWFRQLPAGVPGAYRIFANLLSAGKVR